MDISLVICTYNRAHLLAETLQAVVAQQVPRSVNWQIIVVDNNSRDNTREVVDGFIRKSSVPLIYAFEPRQGQSYARNTGIEIARGGIVAFTDDDVIPEKMWIAKVVTALDHHQADGVGGRILPKWEAPVPRWLERNPHVWWCLAILDSEKARFLVWPEVKGGAQIWGANMAFRRTVFQDVGCFDIGLGHVGNKLYRGEETELIRRSLRKGKRLVYDPELTVYHRIGADRMRKNFFRKVAFDTGEARAERSVLECSVALFGAPRWLYRVAATGACQWIAHALLRRKDAFGCQVDFLDSVGTLWRYWKLGLAKKAG